MEEVSEYLQQVENQLESCSKRLTKMETFALGVRLEAKEEIESIILSDVVNRFEVLCRDIEDMLSRVEEIERMLRMAELPLLPIKEALTKAFVQHNSCKEKLTKVEPYFKESPAYLTSEERLQSLNQTLQRAYKESQKVSGLESEVRACREQLKDQVRQFETQGVSLIKEEILFVTSTFRTKFSYHSFRLHVPCMRLYEEYYDDIDLERTRARWMAMSERYRDAFQAFQEMLKEGLVEEAQALRETEYWLYREERKSKKKH
ncbi:HB5 protein [Chlamydia pneumoniae TW-183]|uniref:HB5 protein n=2 Tax=Chlamydia pneumoniae TaxID=83558 RepID=Q9Z9D9_CHLPN|nr:hypothetical protein CPn_0042 [Chlamydia pneumoniae CWL029]AAF38537.1 hypothetical protein CP_0732 [Chlamydia pneumoniae AR39]AAP97979.1 HB5 protein [Chlamydia pneumoniae TW-183]CRI32538.1 HB5 protein [Chlamydia pneumoniae]BAA98254.1 hypothetical protein [Chlamydia pneumoniae J138]